jgi:glyoxylase-like metal-dependent hydrolase (beta-lactamase superfamily II)
MSDVRIHTYTAAEQGLLVNSYLLESADGVVLVDANLLVSDAHALAARIAALHKPLVAAFVTHAHPDHFNGLPYVVGDDVPVYATKAVAETIEAIAEPKRDQWQPVFGDEWPDRYRVPDHQVADGAVIAVGDLRVRVHDVGAGESHADSYLVVDDAAFIGDLAFAGTHSYLSDGHSDAWLRNLDRLADELRGFRLYPGHGAPGGVELLADQRRYLLMYRETVRRLANGAPTLTDGQKHELTSTMEQFLPEAPLAWLVALGADPVATELAGVAIAS